MSPPRTAFRVATRRNRWLHASFLVGAALVAALVGLALLSFVWTPYSAVDLDIPNKLAPPSAAHWLGTDSLGRDIVLLLIVGSRVSIAVGLVAVGIGIAFGVALGLLAAVQRGWVEELVMRFADFTFAFPALLSAIMLTAIYGPGLFTSIVAIGIFNVPVFARITRASALVVRSREYVLAAACPRQERMAHHARPRAAQHRRGADRAGDDPVRHRHPRRSGAELSWAGHATADAVVGPHAQRGATPAVPGAAGSPSTPAWRSP